MLFLFWITFLVKSSFCRERIERARRQWELENQVSNLASPSLYLGNLNLDLRLDLDVGVAQIWENLTCCKVSEST